MPIPFERDIPRFPAHFDSVLNTKVPSEPNPQSWPTLDTSIISDDLRRATHDLISYYIGAPSPEVRSRVLKDIVTLEDPTSIQFEVLMLLQSIYQKPLEPQSSARKGMYQKLYDRIEEKMGGRASAIRHSIDELMTRNGPGFHTQIPGIRVVEYQGERPKGEDCFKYVYGEDLNRKLTLSKSAKVPGAVANYYSPFFKTLAHVGIVAPNGKIISKWGRDFDVYEHPEDFVPPIYGRLVGFTTFVEG